MAQAPEDLMSLEVCGQRLQQALQGHPAPVARDLALQIRGSGDLAAAAFRLQRYQRKLDVARQVLCAYDEGIQRATDPTPLPPVGYLALAWLCWRAARDAGGPDRLRWLNSGFYALDHVAPAAGDGMDQALALALEALLADGPVPA